MSQQPYWAPTGKLLVPIGTQTLVGDIVSGGGIIPGTTVISIATIAGTIGDYLELTLSQTPGTFSAVSVPSGVTNHNQQSTSILTGSNLGYTSNVTFSRLTSSQVVETLNIPNKTLSFKEDVKGWVSFKSFVPESGISLASDYHTVLNGKLYKHHIEDVNRNHFYGVDYNSSVNVILNDGPGSVKSFHTLDYEGSQSRVVGIKQIDVDSIIYTGSGSSPDGSHFYFTSDEWDILLDIIDPTMTSTSTTNLSAESNIDIKQYRNNILIKSGPIKIWDNIDGIHGRWNDGTTVTAYDWEVGDIITTELQENSVSHFNITLKDGWYISGIETDKQEGNIHEFIEKEGKWFNYIKGVDSDITSETDFGAFDIQGIGTLKQTITSDNSQQYKDDQNIGDSLATIETIGWDWINNIMEFDGPINTSLQIGDIIYYQQASNITTLGEFDVINPNEIVKFGKVTNITSNTITIDENVFGGGNIPDPYHGAFIFLAKNHTVNTSSLLGYFADVKFENNSTDKIELFSVGSEITQSSK